MTKYTLDGQEMIIDENLLYDLAKRCLPKGMSADAKKAFADHVRFLIADLDIDEPFCDCDGISILAEHYFFLACLIYAQRHGYTAVLECEDDLKIFDCMDNVTAEIYDEFVEKTSDATGEVDNEYFIKWIVETLYE